MLNINIDLLKNTHSGDIICSGTFVDGGNTNIQNTGKLLKWVAVRGVIGDFAIYHEDIFSPKEITWSDTRIAINGDKLPKEYVQYVVHIDSELLNERYRT